VSNPRLVKYLRTIRRRADTPCQHRGVVLRTVKRKCCGNVPVFYCGSLRHEVEETKCRSCGAYESQKAADIQSPKVCPIPSGVEFCSKWNILSSPFICCKCFGIDSLIVEQLIEDVKSNRTVRVSPCIHSKPLRDKIKVKLPSGKIAVISCIACEFFKEDKASIDCWACDFYLSDDNETNNGGCKSYNESGQFDDNLLLPCVSRAYKADDIDNILCSRREHTERTRPISGCLDCKLRAW